MRTSFCGSSENGWLRALCGACFRLPVFYLVPYVSGQVPGPNQSLSVLSLGLIPLTFAYAVVKFRLMDVDVIFRRGVAYSLATTTLLALFYGLALLLGGMAELPLRELTPATWVLSVIAAALLFQPLRGWIQTKLEERLYRERYDYRRTLVDFASELSSETDLDHAVTSFSDRLVETLALRRLAVFVAPDPERALGAGGFKLIWGHGLTDAHGAAIELGNGLDLSFLAPDLAAAVTPNSGSRPYLFYENPRWPDAGSGSAPPRDSGFGPELLCPLPRARQSDRLSRTRQDQGGRLSFERRSFAGTDGFGLFRRGA